MDVVTVFEFEIYDPKRKAWLKSSLRATEEAIASLGGVPIRSSAMVVDATRVGKDGFLNSAPRLSA